MNILILISLINCAMGANVLYISSIGSHSHHIWNSVLALGLSKKGYNVTMLSHYNVKSKPENFHLILLEGIYDKDGEIHNFTVNSANDLSSLGNIKLVYDYSKIYCEHNFATKGLSTLINYPKDFKFNLIIFDVTIQSCLYPIIDRFNNPPVVGVTPFLLSHALSYTFGNPLESSYMPIFSTTFTDKMSFIKRLVNFALVYMDVLYRQYIALPEEFAMAKKHFGDNTRSLEEIERNISLLLANTDPILEYPLDLPPNIIPVGGLHIQPAKPLPKDLLQIVTDAKHGVIVFSLGTFLKSNQISPSKRAIILNAFAKLPQTIIWKFESDSLIDLPKNVIMKKWLPQSDLIAHINVKLLISHGGALSTQEALYHCVPLISIPFFVDQFANSARLKHKKVSQVVDYASMTTESFYETIIEVLNNPVYRNNIKTLSNRYRDKLNTPLETAIFWVEYVLRHGSADHLGLAARDMPFFQKENLDVYAVLILGIYLIYSIVCLLFTCLKVIIRFLFKSH